MAARLAPGRGVKHVRAHVLVIEADPDISQLVTMLLEEEGYRITCARGGSIGLMLMRATLHPMVVWVGERPGDITLEAFLAAVTADTTLESHVLVFFVHDMDGLADLRAKYPALTGRMVQLPVSSDDMLATIADAAAALGSAN
jgi:DNA-binding NtrC family response regulator